MKKNNRNNKLIRKIKESSAMRWWWVSLDPLQIKGSQTKEKKESKMRRKNYKRNHDARIYSQ